MFERAATFVLQCSDIWKDCLPLPSLGYLRMGFGMKAAVCREPGQPLVIKEELLPHCDVIPGRTSCNRRRVGPDDETAIVRLAAFTPNLPIPETTAARGALHFELAGHSIEWEQRCASFPSGCGLAFEFSEGFARSHERAGDRLHLEMQHDPGLR